MGSGRASHAARSRTKNILRILTGLSLALLMNCAGVRPALTGPMAGVTGPDFAEVWFQTRATANVRIRKHGFAPYETLPVRTNESGAFTGSIRLSNLEPDSSVRYSLIVETEAGALETEAFVLRTAPLEGSELDFDMVLGSCSYKNDLALDPQGKGGDYQIFQHMANRKPRLVLWLGDNTYLRLPDLLSPSGMESRFMKDRALPELAPLLHTGSHYAIWDDHDFGPNDAKRNFIFKNTSLSLFKRYWRNPPAAGEGIYTSFRYADAEFFLLDDRWFRDDDKSQALGRGMLGRVQLLWLKEALRKSSARFKVVANGSQLFNDQNRFEGWQNFPEERLDFLNWAEKEKISGLLFLSGDRHRTEMIGRTFGTLSIIELTCSPLTSSARPAPESEKDNPSRVSGTLVEKRNFCTIAFTGRGNTRTLTMASVDAEGQELWRRDLGALTESVRARSKSSANDGFAR